MNSGVLGLFPRGRSDCRIFQKKNSNFSKRDTSSCFHFETEAGGGLLWFWGRTRTMTAPTGKNAYLTKPTQPPRPSVTFICGMSRAAIRSRARERESWRLPTPTVYASSFRITSCTSSIACPFRFRPEWLPVTISVSISRATSSWQRSSQPTLFPAENTSRSSDKNSTLASMTRRCDIICRDLGFPCNSFRLPKRERSSSIISTNGSKRETTLRPES
mmetsp:Transcript_10756/g.27193  ORF Transcript_10756/g.27193 Transcript_10756/m.27193 type:complete len:217 (+) Transcript_10756:719-1369(+)